MTQVTFEQFQNTRQWIDSIADHTGYAMTGNTQGFVYYAGDKPHPDLHIFAPNGISGPYELETGQPFSQTAGPQLLCSPDLDALERKLYDFAMEQGWLA